MNSTLKEDILKLSVPERIELVEEIWQSIAATPEVIPITEAQKAELGRRLAFHQENPDVGAPWKVVKDRLAKRS